MAWPKITIWNEYMIYWEMTMNGLIMILYNLLLWHDDEWYEFIEWHDLWLRYEMNHMIYYLWNDNEWFDYDMMMVWIMI